MKNRLFFSLLIAIAIIPGITNAQQKVRIKDILDKPGNYENEQVIITGIVTQYFEATTKTTSYYMVQGDYGDAINVNTSSNPPQISKNYNITGIVVMDQVSGRPVIIEQSRLLLDKGSIIIYVLIAIVFILVVLLGLYLFRGRANVDKLSPEIKKSSSSIDPLPSSSSTSFSGGDYATIRIKQGPPPTMVLLPGQLEIISGLDKGKSFRIAGFPTSEGAKVTIGRETVDGDLSHAHIQLLEKTVSRKQAELTFKNNILYVKNLSETNYTQVDGKALSPNETMELKPDMILRTGEVEFKYSK